MSRRPGAEGYAAAAPHLIAMRLPFEEVHAPILPLPPQARARILDAGVTCTFLASAKSRPVPDRI